MMHLHKINDHNGFFINAYCIVLQENLFWDNMLHEKLFVILVLEI